MTKTPQNQTASYVGEILTALGRQPDRVALISGGRRMTAREVRDLTYRLARALNARGLGPGTTVALLTGNSPEAFVLRHAVQLAGCQITYLRHDLSTDLHSLLLGGLGDHALVVDPGHIGRGADIAARAGTKDFLVLGTPHAPDERWSETSEDLLAAAARVSAEPFACPARPDAVHTLLHTGGSTGHPKGVCHTAAQQVGFRLQLLDLRPPGGRELLCTPPAAIGGYLADLALYGGGTVVLTEGFDAAGVLEVIERERISGVYLPPPMLFELLDHPDLARRDTSSLTHIVYGGCAASPRRVADALSHFGPVLIQVYGQTETGIITALRAEDHDPDRPERLRSVGKALPGVQVAVRDESGLDLPTGAVGEICVKSPMVMRGYWKQPELTRESLSGGWLRTGDLGCLDEHGYLTVAGRANEVINKSVGRIHPAEIEDVLNSRPDIADCAVFGVRRSDWTEDVHAVVVPVQGTALDHQHIREFVRTTLGARYEPSAVTVAAEIPLTESGKPDKKLLRQRAQTTVTVGHDDAIESGLESGLDGQRA
ncbi:AMP-binding protein [Streptomyces purpureus]|uniref:Fatty acid CoA ligase n=1 Tax=Streptomyces purpureus TaxID=1951 RepID=A0A918H988_9ACTN|nr:AMP-binding protein [Streptomyces purpureus]GGT46225.1 fatty acid CoA ligase [Streptomyces purpureus]